MPKGLYNKVKCLFDKRNYVVSTAYDKGGYWSTAVFHSWSIGVPKSFKPLYAIVRNDENNAKDVHHLVVDIVKKYPITTWHEKMPSPKSEEGYNVGANKKIHQELFNIYNKWVKLLSNKMIHSPGSLIKESEAPAPKEIIQEAIKTYIARILLDVQYSNSDIENLRTIYMHTSDIVSNEDYETNEQANELLNASNESVQKIIDGPYAAELLEKSGKQQQICVDEMRKNLAEIEEFIKLVKKEKQGISS